MKPRVLQFIGSFNQGGSERHGISLCRSLAADDTFEVYAATLNYDGALTAEVESIGMPPIPEFPLTSFVDANFLSQVRRCAAYLRESRIALVHTHDFYTNVFGMAAAKLAGVKARVASKRETYGMRSRLQDTVERVAFAAADRIVVNSAAVQAHIERRGVKTDKIVRIYNGVDLERFSHFKVEKPKIHGLNGLSHDRSAKIVTLVANLRHSVKNVPMLLEAAARVANSVSDAHFVIAGEGPLESELRERAAALGIGQNVHFIGRCTNVPDLLSISRVGVLSSDAEGFSNSILEYMAAGKPVVATDVGGAAEAIAEGETGYLVPSGDSARMAARLVELLANDEMSASFGRAGRERVEQQFSMDRQLELTKKLYRDLIR